MLLSSPFLYVLRERIITIKHLCLNDTSKGKRTFIMSSHVTVTCQSIVWIWILTFEMLSLITTRKLHPSGVHGKEYLTQDCAFAFSYTLKSNFSSSSEWTFDLKFEPTSVPWSSLKNENFNMYNVVTTGGTPCGGTELKAQEQLLNWPCGEIVLLNPSYLQDVFL